MQYESLTQKIKILLYDIDMHTMNRGINIHKTYYLEDKKT